MDVSNLSSNWRILQGRLNTPSQAHNSSNSSSVKRKRGPETTIKHEKRPKQSEPLQSHRPSLKDLMPLGRSKSHNQHSASATQRVDDLPNRPSTSHSNHEPNLETKENEGVSAIAMAGKYVALDCEMVGVGPTPDQDSQLARVSMVNFHGEQIYDTYVRPQLPVTDYRTAVSGIRPDNLKNGRPFKEVQKDVETFLQGRILVGHYLKSDFNCLQLKHPKKDVRDSSHLPKFREMTGGRGPKLKVLAKLVLGLDIQDGEHNSVEDARATMMLYKAERDAFEAEINRSFPSNSKSAAVNGAVVSRNKRRLKKKR